MLVSGVAFLLVIGLLMFSLISKICIDDKNVKEKMLESRNNTLILTEGDFGLSSIIKTGETDHYPRHMSHYFNLYPVEFSSVLTGFYFVEAEYSQFTSTFSPWSWYIQQIYTKSRLAGDVYFISYNASLRAQKMNEIGNSVDERTIVYNASSPWSVCSLRLCPQSVALLQISGTINKFHDYRMIFESFADFPRNLQPVHGCDWCSQFASSGNLAVKNFKNFQVPTVLVIFTVCNHIEATIVALDYIEDTGKKYKGAFQFDILIMDDNSSDGTSEYLKRRGYAVISSQVPTGLTHMWNVGYKLAKEMNYEYVVFSNNDVLMSFDSLEILVQALSSNPLAVPTTNFIGAGHNPRQALTLARKLITGGITLKDVRHAMYKPSTRKEKHFLALEDYCMTPSNTDFIQDYLNEEFQRAKGCHFSIGGGNPMGKHCPPLYVPSKFKNKTRFNGFVFAVNLTSAQNFAFNETALFDPANVMVEQENQLALKMDYSSLQPVIVLHSYVYHFKSVTVDVANFTAGKNETRNNLSLYHLKHGHDISRDYRKMNRRNPLNSFRHHSYLPTIKSLSRGFIERYPLQFRFPVIAFAISDPQKNPLAGDIFTAKEMALHLRINYKVYAKLLHKNKNYYDAKNVDVIIAMLDDFDPTKIMNAKPALIKIAWMRNWFHRWFSRSYLGNFDLVLSSSKNAQNIINDLHRITRSHVFPTKCSYNCPDWYNNNVIQRVLVPTGLLRLATNKHVFRPGKPNPSFISDYIFAGSRWNKNRDVQAFFASNNRFHADKTRNIANTSWRGIRELKGILVGSGWHRGTYSEISVVGPVPYRKMPLVYRSCKVAIDDANFVTKPWGSINSRVFDALASGAIVITNGVLDIDDAFQEEKLPTYANVSDLQQKIYSLVLDDERRIRMVTRLRKETLSKHTYDVRAHEFVNMIKELFDFKFTEISDKNAYVASSVSNSASVNMDGSNIVDSNDKFLKHDGGNSDDGMTSSMKKIQLPDNQSPTCDFSSIQSSICVGVRTMPSHKEWIGTMISGLSNQYRESLGKEARNELPIGRIEKLQRNGSDANLLLTSKSLGLQIYIADTEIANTDYLQFLRNLVNQANENMFFNSRTDHNCHVRLLYDTFAPFRRTNNILYGYDSTDMMLKVMLSDSHCDWILFSNGDNFYNRAWFTTVSSVAASNRHANIIGWNFITHHVREGQFNSEIKVKLERAHFDLGSVMIRSSAFYQDNDDRCWESELIKKSLSSFSTQGKKKNPHYDSYYRFLPQSIATEDTFARDFHLIRTINKSLSYLKHVRLIDACLMFHQ